MTLAEAQAERTLVQGAISKILSGGNAAIGSNQRHVQKLPLKDLYARLRELDVLISRLSNGTFSVVQFRDPE